MKRLNRDYSWLCLTLLGAAAFVLALGFKIGTVSNMGSAIFPLILSAIIAGTSAYSFLLYPRETEPTPNLRPMLAVAFAVIAFILFVERAGLIPAVIVSMLIAHAGQTEGNYRFFLVYTTLFAAGSWGLFSLALGIPLQPFQLP